MQYLLGIDIGTSGTKSVLFDVSGKAVASYTVEYPMYQPQNGWAEQKPSDWWNATLETIRQVLTASAVHPEEIAGIGISGQMHGLVMLDENGEVIRDSIIWCDQRTTLECEQITEAVGKERLIQITANPALTGFTASKILWVRNNEPDNYARCKKILLPKDYIRYKLTGVFATEVSDASGMQLLDIKNRCWSEEVLQKLDINPDLLAEVYESPEVTGGVSASAAQLTGLTEGTIVVGGAGDNAAAAVGTGVVVDHKAFTTIGTSGVVYAHTSQMSIDPQGRVHTFCCAVPGEWHVMGVTQAAGLSLQWFRNNFCYEEVLQAKKENIDPYVLMTAEAAEIPIGSEKLLYLPYLMGERTPHMNPDCRGVFFGLSGKHTRAHLIRAVLEGVAYSLKDCVSILEEMGVQSSEMLACGGGGRSALWRSMLADLYGCNITTVDATEGPALGVAILAGVGAGIYPSVPEACERMIRKDSSVSPDSEKRAEYLKYYELFKALYPVLLQQYADLARIN